MALNPTGGTLDIIGCGPGGGQWLTLAAIETANRADVLAGPERLFSLFPGAPGRRIAWCDKGSFLDDVASALEAGERVAALVSGDCGLFSLARSLVARFGKERCRLLPGVSSVQMAFARLGEDWAGAKIVSAHGGEPAEDVDELAEADKIAVALDAGAGWDWLIRSYDFMAQTHELYICANLTLPDEAVVPVADAEALDAMPPPRLAVGVWLRRKRV